MATRICGVQPAVKIGEQTRLKRPKWFIDLPGADTAQAGWASIDGRYALIPVLPGYSYGLAPSTGSPHPAFGEVAFLANCMAYEYEVPSFVWNVGAVVKPIEKPRSAYANRAYRESMNMIHEVLTDIRFGIGGLVRLPESSADYPLDLQYTQRYSPVVGAVGLYATAIRQVDPLSEFLCYYRVIERTSASNGKKWIARSLDRLRDYDFGFLEFANSSRPAARPRNLFSIYRRRALNRLRKLKVELPGLNIQDYLYNENRCGIAHGRHGIKVYDFGQDVQSVAQDCYVLKLLARIGIEDQL